MYQEEYRQLWIGDSLNLTQNTANQILWLSVGGIDCIATNGTPSLPIFLGNTGATPTINGSAITWNGNTTINGDLYLKNNTWHRSFYGVYRLYYATNDISFYCCGGNSTDGHKCMNNAYSHVLKINYNGDLHSSGGILVINAADWGPKCFKRFNIQKWIWYSK